MNSPLTTPSSRLLMTSKARFLCDGAGGVYLKCYFSLLSSTSSALRGPWEPCVGAREYEFRPYLTTSSSGAPTSRH